MLGVIQFRTRLFAALAALVVSAGTAAARSAGPCSRDRS
jgi:hypothetical protein